MPAIAQRSLRRYRTCEEIWRMTIFGVSARNRKLRSLDRFVPFCYFTARFRRETSPRVSAQEFHGEATASAA